MQKLSLVTAKVVRENEQYAYKLVGKGEKYLVLHEDGEKAEDRVISELSPFAKEPVVIDSVVVQKNAEVLEAGDGADSIFRVAVKSMYIDEVSGKEKKATRKLFVRASTIENAISAAKKHELFGSVASISETKILDVLSSKPE